jgi:KDO2-lipid IV(A) lauroyltransferase
VVRENLRNSFPEKNKEELKKIETAYYRHLCDLFVETIKIIHLSPSEIKKRCRFNNLEILEDLSQKNKSFIGVLGHLGNWEWSINLPLFAPYYKVLAMYKPLSSKDFNNFYKELRSKYGAQPISMKESYKRMYDYSRNNIITATAFISDQTPHKDEIHYWKTFLNQETPVFLGSENVAKKLNQAVLFFRMRKVKRGYYEFDIIPITENPETTELYEITNKHLLLLEETIKQQPEIWLWSHRRWKYKRPQDVTLH